MQLRSMSTGTAGAQETAAVTPRAALGREVLDGRRGTDGGEISLAERHLIVRGKREEPLPRRRMRRGPLETLIGQDDRTRILETHPGNVVWWRVASAEC